MRLAEVGGQALEIGLLPGGERVVVALGAVEAQAEEGAGDAAGQSNRVGLVLLVLLAGCLIVLRPFMSALLWAVVLCISSWPVYRRLLDKGAAGNNDETRAYVKDKFRSALWLIKSVEQRQKTIHKVANSIINFQRDFLDHGIEHLRPLVLRDVANDIGMHESTVSRVVTNKYMHTPQGVFEMKYFFHSGISSSYGESVSSVTIKQRIRKIIENEDARKPLSDSKIVSILQREGLMLARRTIAKYREELKIPTSNQRKVLY